MSMHVAGPNQKLSRHISILCDDEPLPRRHFGMSEEGDNAQLEDCPIVDAPVRMDYGFNVKYVQARPLSL